MSREPKVVDDDFHRFLLDRSILYAEANQHHRITTSMIDALVAEVKAIEEIVQTCHQPEAFEDE